LNDGGARFSRATWTAGAAVTNGWNTAFADIDLDGDLDLLVASRDGVRVLGNEGNRNHWLAVKLDDARCNRAGIGARIEIRYDGQRQVRVVRAGKGSGSQAPAVAHFGLGAYQGPVEIEVRNACGARSQHQTREIDRYLRISIGDGSAQARAGS
jgi:hypothetical protein